MKYKYYNSKKKYFIITYILLMQALFCKFLVYFLFVFQIKLPPK